MNDFQLFIRTMRVMGKRLPIYLIAILLMSVSFATFSVMGSLLMKNVVDIAQTGNYQSMAISIIGITGIGILSLFIYRFAAIKYNVEAKRVFGKLSEAVLNVEMRLPYTYYEKHHSGEIISKISYDLSGIGNIFGSRFRRVVMPLLEVIVYLIPMFLLSWQLTLCLVAVNLIVVLTDILMVKPMHKVRTGLSEANKNMTSRLSDLLQGIEQVRMYPAGKDIVQRFQIENKNYAKTYYSQIFLSSCLESLDKGFDLLCSLFFLIIGIYFVKKGYTTLGSLAAIYTLYTSFSIQFLMLGKYIPELAACLVNAKNIFDFLDETQEPENWYQEENKANNNKIKNTTKEMVYIKNISFSYNKGEEVLKDFSLAVTTGENIAITGPSGYGKTTLSKLLLGLYPISKGDIIINGKDIKESTLKELRKQIAYVPQESYLFQGTIKENIGYAKKGATEEEIIEAAKLANAHDFIMEFPDGYHTQISERGKNMSGGQRQRIAIARAILKDAPILLLDEATSALDNESEQFVNEAMKNLKGKKTIIMIAHRPSTIELADRECTIDSQI